MKNEFSSRFSRIIYAITVLIVMGAYSLNADINRDVASKDAEEVQRTPRGEFDQQLNSISNFEFHSTNYGVWGYNVANGRGGGFWPRASQNQYMFAAGVWFAGRKKLISTDTIGRKRVMITYNPNTGQSWMAPGSVDDGFISSGDAEAIQKNRVYFSTDVSPSDGTPYVNSIYPKWPIWDTDAHDTVRFNNYYGKYVNDISLRNRFAYSKGPTMISGEDIFTIYKDTDLSRYEGGTAKRRQDGYPLGFQIEQTVYSWGFGDYRDFIFIKYMFIHPSKYFKDTLRACYMAAVLDIDIALATNPIAGAQNDRAIYYDEEDTLNLAVQWTNGDAGEAGKNFGYLGFTFLESPAVDVDNYIRKDKRKFDNQEQLGLTAYKNWPITEDPNTDERRYDFISIESKPQRYPADDQPGDRRLLFGTGPFNMVPDDSARIVIGVVLGNTTSGRDATGEIADMAELIRKVKFAHFVYNNNFRAPEAPNRSVIKGIGRNTSWPIPQSGWEGLNNAVVIQWDSTAELSVDTLERGMDFMGFRIYRARRADLDTFDVDQIDGKRKGPLAWREVRSYSIPSPWLKSDSIARPATISIDYFDFAEAISPSDRMWLVKRYPTFAAPWGRYFSNMNRDIYLRDGPTAFYPMQSNGRVNTAKFTKLDSIRHVYLAAPFDSLPRVTVRQAQLRDGGGTVNIVDSAEAEAAKTKLIALIRASKVKMIPFGFRDVDTIQMADNTTFTYSIPNRPWEETNEVRHVLISGYTNTLTNGRVFYDNGDDNSDGTIQETKNLAFSEKLINNVDYFYGVLAFDEGDWLLPIDGKSNVGKMGLPNVARTHPMQARGGTMSKIELVVLPEDRDRMGGIYNVRLDVPEKTRFSQMFSGRTLEVEFTRTWIPALDRRDPSRSGASFHGGFYALIAMMRDSATQRFIGGWGSPLPPELCGSGASTESGAIPGYFTTNAFTWVDADTSIRLDTVWVVGQDGKDSVAGFRRIINFGMPFNDSTTIRYGTYTSTARCFSGNRWALGTVGLEFDYAIQQSGGRYRAKATGNVVKGPAGIMVGSTSTWAEDPAVESYWLGRADLITSFDEMGDREPYYRDANVIRLSNSGGMNNGRGIYELEFLPGGTETITTEFRRLGTDVSTAGERTFPNVPFYNVRVRNVYEFNRVEQTLSGAVDIPVQYPFDLKLLKGPTRDSVPGHLQVPPGYYSLGAYGWRNTRLTERDKPTELDDRAGIRRGQCTVGPDSLKPLGTQGRYYVSRTVSTSGTDTLDFCHFITIGGLEFVIDFSWKVQRSGLGGFSLRPQSVSIEAQNAARKDFEVGDKVQLISMGGAFGFPHPGAKVYAKVSQGDLELNGKGHTDASLDEITVVPNPYYVKHEAERSPWDAKIFFTRLPRVCTIDIYTTAGDHIQTIEHNEHISPEPHKTSIDVWRLMSKNAQRVASQTLIARISIPNGAETVKKFTVVVGPARVVEN